MVHGVECCRKIKQNKKSYLSLINCTENVIANSHQGSFCAVIAIKDNRIMSLNIGANLVYETPYFLHTRLRPFSCVAGFI